MRSARHGLTLLETLLASAILAMMAATCVQTLSSALRTVSPTSLESAGEMQALRFDLGRLADALMHDPGQFGVKDVARETERSPFAVNWPKQLSNSKWSAVTVRRLPSSPTADHRWLIFESDGATVVRYLAVPKPPAKEQARP